MQAPPEYLGANVLSELGELPPTSVFPEFQIVSTVLDSSQRSVNP